jgi:hypothetical protein
MILNSTNPIDKVNFNIIKTKKNLIFFFTAKNNELNLEIL